MKITDIIKYPILTEKTYQQMQENIYTFAVDKKASKFEIKKAVEFIFKVKVDKINTFNVPKKAKKVGRFKGYVSGYKKAIIKLLEGTIKILPDEGISESVEKEKNEDKKINAKVKEISEAEKKAAEKIKKAKSQKENQDSKNKSLEEKK